MAEETDGIEEAFEGQVRILVTAAGQVAERLARAREHALRRAQTHSEQQAREMQSRLEAERRAARAELASVYRADWWDRATPEQIGHAYQTARGWVYEDTEAVRAEQRIRDELRTRFGIDADNAGAVPADVQAAIQLAQHDRAQVHAERTREQAERGEAHRLLRDADHEELRADHARAAARDEPEPDERLREAAEAEQRKDTADHLRANGRAMYDSAERRRTTAHKLVAKGLDQEVVAVRMRADISQSRPATDAVKSTSKTPRARSIRGQSARLRRTGLNR